MNSVLHHYFSEQFIRYSSMSVQVDRAIPKFGSIDPLMMDIEATYT